MSTTTKEGREMEVDVDLLRIHAERDEREARIASEGAGGYVSPLRALADRLAALLPPPEDRDA